MANKENWSIKTGLDPTPNLPIRSYKALGKLFTFSRA